MPGRPSRVAAAPVVEIAREMTTEPAWKDTLSGVYTDHALLDPAGYITLLGDLGLRAEARETDYAYPLTGGGRLLEYWSGSVLRPALAPLAAEEAERFTAEFSRRVSEAYPPRVIGGESVELLQVSRVFAVGQS
jgi:trans-aconitate 2-methyltransferase